MEQSDRPTGDETPSTDNLSGGGTAGEPEPPREMPFFRPAPFPASAPEVPPTDVATASTPAPSPLVTTPVPIPAETAPQSGVSGANDWSVGKTLRHAFAAIGRNWVVAIPIALFALAALIVPTMTRIASSDDWPFARAVQTLHDESKLVAPSGTTLTAIGQVAWGDLFAQIFGFNLGVLRLSTVVVTAMGAVAFYAILRMLGVSRNRSVLGTSLLLFNPLSFVLAFTFLPDPHLTAWVLVALALSMKGLDDAHPRARVTVLGSVAAAFAFLISQQGALIPVALICFLISTRRVWFDGAGVRRLGQVAGIPALVIAGYAAWLHWFSDGPAQTSVFQGIRDAGWQSGWTATRYLSFFVLMYLGIILLPILVAVAPGWRGQRAETASFRTPFGYWLFLGVAGAAITGLFFLTSQGRSMPYLARYVGLDGLGIVDVPGGRAPLITGAEVPQILTIVAALGAIVAGLLISRQLVPEPSPQRAVAGIVVMVASWQLAGIIVRSFAEGQSDRLLLPMIPLGIALLLWALRDVRVVDAVGWVVLAIVAVGSVAGTRDALVTMDAAWSLATKANASGVVNTNLDAGVAWDGYHAPDAGVGTADLRYIVTTDPTAYPDFVVVEQKQVDAWLDDDATTLVLMRRNDAPWPAASVPESPVSSSPVATPVASPEASPIASPVVSPVASPVAETSTVTLSPTATATPSPTQTPEPSPTPQPTKPSGGDDLPVLAVGS